MKWTTICHAMEGDAPRRPAAGQRRRRSAKAAKLAPDMATRCGILAQGAALLRWAHDRNPSRAVPATVAHAQWTAPKSGKNRP